MSSEGFSMLQQNFLNVFQSHLFQFTLNLCRCITNGALPMPGSQQGFKAGITVINNKAKHMSCMIYRQALAAKRLPSELKKVLDFTVKTVNFEKLSALNIDYLNFFIQIQILDIKHFCTTKKFDGYLMELMSREFFSCSTYWSSLAVMTWRNVRFIMQNRII